MNAAILQTDAPATNGSFTSHTGAGGQPEGWIVFGVPMGVDGSGADAQMSMGWRDVAGNQRSTSIGVGHNQATSNDRGGFSTDDGVYAVQGGSGIYAHASLHSLDADGVTFYWATTTNGIDFKSLLLWGSDVEVASGHFTAATTTGNQTPVNNLAWTPNVALFQFSATITTGDQAYGQSRFSLGAAVSASQRFSLDSFGLGSQASAYAIRRWRNDRCLQLLDGNTSGTLNGDADFVQFTTASGGTGGGFTINWTDAPSAAWIINYLLLQVPAAQIVTATVPASTGTQVISTPGMLPKAVIAVGGHAPFSSANANNQRISLGAAVSPSSRAGIAVSHQHAADPTIAHKRSVSNKLITAISGTGPTTDYEADLSAFSSGSLTLNWTTVSSSDQVALLVLGDVATSGGRSQAVVVI